MHQLLAFLFVLLCINQSWAADLCSPTPRPENRLTQIVRTSCSETFQSQACQDLYKRIKANGGNSAEKALQCASSESSSRTFENSWGYASGCAAGGWNFVKDTFVSVGTAIGEGAAKIVLDIEAENAANAACDKDPQIKLGLFKQYNEGLPKLLQVDVPSEQVLAKAPCANIKSSLKLQIHTKSQQEGLRIMRKASLSQSLTPQEKEVVSWNQSKFQSQKSDTSLIEMAKAKLREAGVKLECYNSKEAAAMVCEAVAEVATLVGGPAAAALKAAKLKNISKISGIALNEQKAVTAQRAVASAEELAAAAKLSNPQRIQAAESSLGRALNESEKKALIAAHEVGSGTGRGYGTYSAADLNEKARLMKEAGFTTQERELLMRQGIAGSLSDTRAAQNFAQKTRLEAEKLRAGGDIAGSTTKFRSAADSYEVYIKDAAVQKSSRDYWVGAKLNASAEKYDKAADYFIKSEQGTRNAQERAQNIFEGLNREKDELRAIAAKNPSSKSAQKAYQDHQKLIEAVVNSPQLQMGDAWKRELLRP
jgi:hypothetical protein